jgi:alkylation response protein AidB-like acyl-CoA dehydrogenase
MGEGALPSPFLGHSLASLAIAEAGSEAQKKTWLGPLAEGRLVGSVALCEEGSVWEPEAWRVEEKGGRLRGSKLFVPHGDLADVLLVGTAEGGLTLVERGAAGLSLSSQEGIDRTRPIFRIDFDDTPCERLPDAAKRVARVGDVGLVLLAADAFGVGSRLVDMSVEYARTREQFGCKIGQFQAVKHQLARLGTDIEPTRALFWYAAYASDHLPDDARRSAALCKAHISDRTMSAARMAVELHGGLGFTWECDVQMWFKRAMFDRAFLGTPEFLRERCAALAGW